MEKKRDVTYRLRWVAVLPGAIPAGLLSNFPLHWFLYLFFSQIIEPYPELPERFLLPFVVATTFVYIGS